MGSHRTDLRPGSQDFIVHGLTVLQLSYGSTCMLSGNCCIAWIKPCGKNYKLPFPHLRTHLLEGICRYRENGIWLSGGGALLERSRQEVLQDKHSLSTLPTIRCTGYCSKVAIAVKNAEVLILAMR